MKPGSDDTDGMLLELAHVRDADLTDLAIGEGARALLQEIVVRPAPLGHRATRTRAVPIATAAVLVAGLVIASQTLAPGVAGAGVDFETRGKYLVARAIDTTAGAEAMTAAFTERGLDVQVELTATSPSLVGMVASLGGPDGSGSIRILEEGDCWLGEQLSGCDVGLLIPRDFDGRAQVIFGRPAEPGEAFDIQGDVFAPGEGLHCYAEPILNGKPSDVQQTVSSAGVAIDWWRVIGGDMDRPDPLEGTHTEQLTPELAEGRFVTGVWALSHGHVGVFLANAPDAPETPAYLRFVYQGCA